MGGGFLKTNNKRIRMSEIIKFSFDDGWEDDSVWHMSHKPNLHKLGIRRGQKTLNNYYSNISDAVFVGSLEYCLTEYPKYTKNGIYHLYKINSWHMYGKKGEWVGTPNHNNTKKTDQFKCYEDILPTTRDKHLEYYGRYKIKNGLAIPHKNGWEVENVEEKIAKQNHANNKKPNPEAWTKVLVEISMQDKKALKANGGKRFYTKRVKKKNLKPMNETQQRIVERSKRKKLLKLQTKP